jgi:anti-sigma factor RsiW
VAEDRIELTDEQLGAYADGELDAVACERVERRLAVDPDARRRLGAIQDVTLIVRAATAAEGGRSRLSRTARRREADRADAAADAGSDRARPASSGVRAWLDWRVAASFVAGALALLIVSQLGGTLDSPGVDWHDNALAFHDMYLRARENAPPDTMLDILEHQPEELARLIRFTASMPDLSAQGYEPAGAHLITAAQGPIVYVAFEGGQRPPIGFAMTRSTSGSAADDIETPVVRATPQGVTLVSWSAGPFEYGLSGELPESELMLLVDTARRSLPTASR